VCGSVWKFTHAPLHRLSPVAHVGTQLPEEQAWPAGHTLPQVPQFLGSLEVLVQTAAGTPGQLVLGERHWHVDAEQTSAGTQACPHAPQFAPLVAVSTHVPVAGGGGIQNVTVVGVVLHTHAPASQIPNPHAWPQVPQLAVSVWKFTQRPPQESGCATVQLHVAPTQVEPG
jgi:hypothetical protein